MLVEINGYSVRSFFRFSDQTSRLMHRLLIGLVNGAPYLCCAVLGCWLTSPLNNWLGRRGTIFLTAALSALTCIWMGVTNSWQHLFAARCVTVPSELPCSIDTDLFSLFLDSFVLGLGIGPKSATVPVYGAETAPPLIRGALVMQWQVWVSFLNSPPNRCFKLSTDFSRSNVDRFRNHARNSLFARFLLRSRLFRYHWTQLAVSRA